MTNLPWFPCFPSDALASCADMDAATFGHYWRLLLYMYQRGGYAPYDEKKLRYILNCSVQGARKVRDQLISDGRISKEGDQITQKKVQKVLKKPAKTSGKDAKNLAKTSQVISDKSLKNKETASTILEPDTEPEEKEANASKKVRKKKRYSDEFEDWWGRYPDAGVGSKWTAYQSWQKLDEEDRRLATEALPVYRSHLAKPDAPKCAHASTFLNQRRFETLQPPQRDWAGEVKLFADWGDWRPDGPAPGQPGCKAPAEVQREHGFEPIAEDAA